MRLAVSRPTSRQTKSIDGPIRSNNANSADASTDAENIASATSLRQLLSRYFERDRPREFHHGRVHREILLVLRVVIDVFRGRIGSRFDDLFEEAMRDAQPLAIRFCRRAMELLREPPQPECERERSVTVETTVQDRQPFFCAASASAWVW
jgi:hypothetical protein